MLDWLKRTAQFYNTIIELSILDDEEVRRLGRQRIDILHEANKQFWKSNELNT
jgi:uncharacterized protein YjiS (DUF1127 family)